MQIVSLSKQEDDITSSLHYPSQPSISNSSSSTMERTNQWQMLVYPEQRKLFLDRKTRQFLSSLFQRNSTQHAATNFFSNNNYFASMNRYESFIRFLVDKVIDFINLVTNKNTTNDSDKKLAMDIVDRASRLGRSNRQSIWERFINYCRVFVLGLFRKFRSALNT